MTSLLLAAVALGAAAIAPPIEHRSRLDHASGAAEVRYRGHVAVEHRQVGAAAPAGRASTLACHWRAGLSVEREARHASGARLARTIDRTDAIEGRRAGWCSTQRAAIAQEVARRTDALRDHLIAVAEEDHHVLRAELDRTMEPPRAG